MEITQVKISNYRSIKDLSIKLDKLNVLCGPNSSGKSNILMILSIVFEDIDRSPREIEDFVRENLNDSKTGSSASIRVVVTFKNAPKSLHDIAGESGSKLLTYSFSATKSGKITRKLGSRILNNELFQILLREFTVIYIPTIRDLKNDGLTPFIKLFKRAMNNSTGNRDLEKYLTQIKKKLSEKASRLLGEQKNIAKNILNAKAIELSPDLINLDHIYSDLKLQIINHSQSPIPMENIGTGHQSAVIINLYKQLGESTPEKTLYLFEEPDAHLHPPTIRSIGSQIQELSNSSQSLISTHSPTLISQVGLDKVIYLTHNQDKGTKTHKIELSSVERKEIENKLLKYGLKITETLFASIVVLVEGPSDAIVISRIIERVAGRSVDQLDIVITPANGKNNITELAVILQKLNVKWAAIFDYDAAFTTSSIPIFQKEALLSLEDKDRFKLALEELSGILNTLSVRGRKSKTQLKQIKNEIINGSPSLEYYNNSCLQNLLRGLHIEESIDSEKLKKAIRKQGISTLREILSPFNIWLVRQDLESAILGKDNSNVGCILPIIKSIKKINVSTDNPNMREQVLNILHKSSSDPEFLIKIVDAVYESKGFSRSDIRFAVNDILNMLD